MKFSYLLAALGATGLVEAATCGTNSIPATIDTATSGANKACICPSGYYDDSASATCTEITAITGCAQNSTSSTQAGLVTLKDLAVVATRQGTSADVDFSVKIPAMNGRYYDKVGFTTAGATVFDSNCLAEKLFKTFKANNSPTTSPCVDTWDITAAVSGLFSCGLNLNTVASAADPGFMVYDGNLKMQYTEPVLVGTDSSYQEADNRTVTFDVPVRIRFQSEYTAELTVDQAKVYSAYTVEWAIVDQNIPKVTLADQAGAGGAAALTMAYTIQYPYAILSLDSVHKGTSATTDNESTPFGVTINNAASATLSGTGLCTLTTDYKMFDGTLASDGSGDTATATGVTDRSTCYKRDNTLDFSGLGASSACKFGTGSAPYHYTVAFTIGCGSGVATADCPLALNQVNGYTGGVGQVPNNYVTFGVESEDFCVGSTANTDTIGPITITRFAAVSSNDFDTPQAGWRYGDKMFMRIDWNGLPLTAIHLTVLKRKWAASTVQGTDWTTVNATSAGTNTGDLGYWASGSDTTDITGTFLDRDETHDIPAELNNAAALSGALSGKKLGLQSSGLSFWFTLALGSDFLGSTVPVRGETRFLQVQATLDVEYSVSRRRRRQAAAPTSSSSGSIQSTEQQISAPETAAVAPNSGMRAAPAVALVLAVLSAVALL